MWFLLALGTALSQGFKDVIIKKETRADGLTLCWAYCFGSAFLLTPFVLYAGTPVLGPDFWWALGTTSVLNSVSLTLYFTAIKASDLSRTAPMLTFTPLFMLVTSPLMVGEAPSLGGSLGIVLIVSGSYIMNATERKNGLLAPFRALVREPGPRMMLCVALIWAFNANVDRFGINNSSPLFWLWSVFLGIGALLTPVAVVRARRRDARRLPAWRSLFLLSAVEAAGLMLQMWALTMTIVPYVIAVKRLSGVFGVLFGFLFLGERGIASRLAGASIMVAGVFCIAFAG